MEGLYWIWLGSVHKYFGGGGGLGKMEGGGGRL